MLGITFKENCPDIRNSKAFDVIKELKEFGCNVDVYDPWADKVEVKKEYNVELIDEPVKKYDSIILAVSHNEFKEFDIKRNKSEKTVVYDIKSCIELNISVVVIILFHGIQIPPNADKTSVAYLNRTSQTGGKIILRHDMFRYKRQFFSIFIKIHHHWIASLIITTYSYKILFR